ncbi:MAG: hypothetical protein QXI58_02120 [Candidatus Micrarchaeia archaeon]
MQVVKREEEERKREEEERKKEEAKKKKEPRIERKKEEIEMEKSGKKYEEPKAVVEVFYEKVPLRESKGEKYEPIVRDELAIMKKDEEKRARLIEIKANKIVEEIRKEEIERMKKVEKEKFERIREIQERKLTEISRLSKKINELIEEGKRKNVQDITGYVIARLRGLGLLKKGLTSLAKRFIKKLLI